MTTLRALVLAWWFMTLSQHGIGSAVGPFRDHADCHRVAEATLKHRLAIVSWCWWDGKP